MRNAIAVFATAALAALFVLVLAPARAYAQGVDAGIIDGPDELIGLGAAALIIPVIVAHLKPVLLPIFRRYTTDPPWEFVADLVGVAWALGLNASGHGPDWMNNVPTAALVGLALGVAAGGTRDGTQSLLARFNLTKAPPESPPRAFTEPGEAIRPGASG